MTNRTLIPACTTRQSDQACGQHSGFDCLHEITPFWIGGILKLWETAHFRRASRLVTVIAAYWRLFSASRISINNFSSFVGPAGGAGGASFLNRLTCLTNMKITNATMMKSNTLCKNTP